MAPAAPAKEKSPEEIEFQEIWDALQAQRFEQATMLWVQSPNSTALFDNVFIKCNPGYLSRIAPLLILSTGAVVTTSLEENLVERLMWLDAVLRNIDPSVSSAFLFPHVFTNEFIRILRFTTFCLRSWR